MNPALLNYLQQMQQQQQPVEAQQMQVPQNDIPPQSMASNGGEQVFNPFDSGIQKAIASARESLGMTQKQKDKALRHSMLTFANNMSQQPKEQGFLNNFASIGRAMSPAIMSYDEQEGQASAGNYDMANKILGYKRAQEEAEAMEKERAFRRQLAQQQHQLSQQQLDEQRRYHDLTFGLQRDQLNQRSLQKEQGGHGQSSVSEIEHILDSADKLIDQSGSKGHRGMFGRFIDSKISGLPFNKEQAEIQTLADVLRSKLFNIWGYKNQAEFHGVPSISVTNPPEVNKAIIQQLRNLLVKVSKDADQPYISDQNPSDMNVSPDLLNNQDDYGFE